LTVELQQKAFGTTANGVSVNLYTFTHSSGVSLAVTNFGCVIQSLITPDKNGALEDIALGYDTLVEYEKDRRFLGCVVGRYANRIANGKFTLDGVEYQLEKNPTGNHLHGGKEGFHKQIWKPSVEQQNGMPLLVLEHSSPHMHGGYPGKLDCRVTYCLNSEAEIEVNYYATTDRATIINLTNHSYFNLLGHQHAVSNSVLNHLAMLNCDSFIPTTGLGIPVSEPVSVDGTAMDFRSKVSIGKRINNDDQQLRNGKGYDHNWVVNRSGNELAVAAKITEPVSGRVLEVATTQPGIQFYTGNNIDGLHGKGGSVYEYRGSLCLETQHYPDSPNQAGFPSTVITPDSSFHEVTVFRVLP